MDLYMFMLEHSLTHSTTRFDLQMSEITFVTPSNPQSMLKYQSPHSELDVQFFTVLSCPVYRRDLDQMVSTTIRLYRLLHHHFVLDDGVQSSPIVVREEDLLHILLHSSSSSSASSLEQLFSSSSIQSLVSSNFRAPLYLADLPMGYSFAGVLELMTKLGDNAHMIDRHVRDFINDSLLPALYHGIVPPKDVDDDENDLYCYESTLFLQTDADRLARLAAMPPTDVYMRDLLLSSPVITPSPSTFRFEDYAQCMIASPVIHLPGSIALDLEPLTLFRADSDSSGSSEWSRLDANDTDDFYSTSWAC
jgi:hypothetical protein